MSWRDAPWWPAPRVLALAAALVAGVSAPWWGRRALTGLSFFQLRHVEIRGATFLQPGDVMARLQTPELKTTLQQAAFVQRITELATPR